MTRNTERDIAIVASPNAGNPWQARLTLQPHTDADQQQYTTIIFFKNFEKEDQARAWAEQLDFMLLYGAVTISRDFVL